MVSRWEVGERGPASEYQERLCEIFKKNAVELGFIESLQIPCPSPAQPLVSSISSMDTDDALIRINQDTPAQFISPVTLQQEISSETLVLHEIEGDDMKKVTRRKFLEVGLEVGTEIGVASLVVPGILNSSESDRLLWMFEDSSIDKTALSSLKKITDSHWQLVYGGVPKRGLLSSVTGHLQSMEHFLQVSQPTAIEQSLSALISQQAQMAVEIYFDLHDYTKAESYSKAAIEAARQAANPTLYAVALARTSFLYTYSHQHQEALVLLQAARRFAKQDSVSAVPYWLAAMEAEVYAKLFASQPDLIASSGSLKALEEAENIIDQPEAGDRYWTMFSSASLAAYKGVCFRHLQKPEEAELALLEALASIHKGIPGGQATALIDLSSVYAQQGKIEEACSSTTHALEVIGKQNKSINTLQRVYDLRSELEPWASTSYVRNLDEQIMVTRLRIAPPSLRKAKVT